MDYLYAKFGDFFSRFGFVVRTDRQSHKITEADNRYIHATTVGVSKHCVRSVAEHCNQGCMEYSIRSTEV